jgi:hypothetical protein
VRFGSDDEAHRFAVARGLADVDEVVAADTLHNLDVHERFWRTRDEALVILNREQIRVMPDHFALSVFSARSGRIARERSRVRFEIGPGITWRQGYNPQSDFGQRWAPPDSEG